MDKNMHNYHQSKAAKVSSAEADHNTRIFSIAFFGFSICLLLAIGCATSPEKSESENAPMKTEAVSLEEKWGIRIEAIRLSAGGYMLDFRYRVIDPDKAVLLTDPKIKPYLIDEASGARFMVPSGGKVGPLRSSFKSGAPEPGRIYFILFANPGKYVKQGNKVTVVIGDFKVENLTVQ